MMISEDQEPEIRVIAMPADANASGDIFGGWLMSHVDLAGSIVAIRIARSRVVTVAVNSFVFLKPVFIGDRISCYVNHEKTGNTSITVEVRTWAERQRNPEDTELVSRAELTYVAIDENGKPRKVSA